MIIYVYIRIVRCRAGFKAHNKLREGIHHSCISDHFIFYISISLTYFCDNQAPLATDLQDASIYVIQVLGLAQWRKWFLWQNAYKTECFLTSWYRHTFPIISPLCGECTWEFPTQTPAMQSYDGFLAVSIDKLLNAGEMIRLNVNVTSP